MNKKTISKVITTLGVVILFTIGYTTGDGYLRNLMSYVSIASYISIFVWIYGRLNGKFRLWNY